MKHATIDPQTVLHRDDSRLTPWPEPVSGSQLLDDLAAAIKRHVVLPSFGAEAIALWILHTYAFELRDVSTYLGIESPEKRCGKTTLLGVLGRLVNRPVVAANISPSAFFRVIADVRPTLLIDEADTFLHGNEELRGILNSGYDRKTAYVVRVAAPTGTAAAGRGPALVKYCCWCPKVMAAIGRLPETLADRSIVIRMHRKTAAEPCERLRHLDGADLRRRCARFVLDHQSQIASLTPPVPNALHDRAWDIWEPLFVLAALAGGEWPRLADDAAAALTDTAVETSPLVNLLLDITLAFLLNNADKLFSRDLVLHLATLPERPWSQDFSKPVSELSLARTLRPYGIRPKPIWIDDQCARGYLLKEIRQITGRYLPEHEARSLVTRFKQMIHQPAQDPQQTPVNQVNQVNQVNPQNRFG